jgi:hypothetical protein
MSIREPTMTLMETIEGALRKDDWWRQLVALIGIPAILSFFAYTYVVGYFLASDLAWFPFFTLSDHVLFAIRALPLVVLASIVFLTVYPNWSHYRWLAWPWFIAVALFAVWSVLTSHIVISAILFMMLRLEFSRGRHEFLKNPQLYSIG